MFNRWYKTFFQEIMVSLINIKSKLVLDRFNQFKVKSNN